MNGHGAEVGAPLASSPRIAKIAFTGETTTGRQIMQYASENLIPRTLELGGKSPNIFFADVMDEDDAFLDKALEGFALFAFNKGEVCTCPSRALVQESIFDKFMERAVARVDKIKYGQSARSATRWAPRRRTAQLEKILNYIDVGKQEGARCLTGGERAHLGGELEDGYYVKPTVFSGHNKMRIFQEEIFGPVLSVTSFKTLRGRHRHRQRHALWPGRRRLVARRHRLSRRPRDPGRPGVDKLLSHVSGARGVWRLQAIRLRA